MPDRQKILIVDDDAFIRVPLEFILRQEGFDIVAAADGDECLHKLDGEHPDLVILDVMMPGKDGFELCRVIKLRPEHADLPVILLSARDEAEDRERGRCLGAADFLTKPYSPPELLACVRRHLEVES